MIPWSLIRSGLKFACAGIVETIKQTRVIKSRERAAHHNLQLAKYAAAIRKTQEGT